MHKTERLFNIGVSNLTMDETIHHIHRAIVNNQQIHYADINAEKVVILQNDKILFDIYESTSIVNIDGQAVFWAAKILKKPIKERVTGVDLMGNLVEFAAKNKYTIYLLGAEESVISKLAEIYEKKHGFELIVGYRNGYFETKDEQEIIDDINSKKPNILFVGMTSPKKELFLDRNKNNLKNVNFIMGVGGSFDVYAGKVKRAPKWMQKSGLEWFYRVLQEPKRMWKRYLIGNTKFILLLLKFKFKSK